MTQNGPNLEKKCVKIMKIIYYMDVSTYESFETTENDLLC